MDYIATLEGLSGTLFDGYLGDQGAAAVAAVIGARDRAAADARLNPSKPTGPSGASLDRRKAHARKLLDQRRAKMCVANAHAEEATRAASAMPPGPAQERAVVIAKHNHAVSADAALKASNAARQEKALAIAIKAKKRGQPQKAAQAVAVANKIAVQDRTRSVMKPAVSKPVPCRCPVSTAARIKVALGGWLPSKEQIEARLKADQAKLKADLARSEAGMKKVAAAAVALNAKEVPLPAESTTIVPEQPLRWALPSYVIPAGIGLVGLVFVWMRRRRA